LEFNHCLLKPALICKVAIGENPSIAITRLGISERNRCLLTNFKAHDISLKLWNSALKKPVKQHEPDSGVGDTSENNNIKMKLVSTNANSYR